MMNNKAKKAAILLLAYFFLFQVVSASFAVTTAPTKAVVGPSATPTPLLPPADPTTGIHLTLSPVFINITTNPGTEVNSSFKVTNNGNTKEYLQVSLIKFKADKSGSNIVPIDIDSSDEFVNWISFSENQFTVDPNETKTINFKISPPTTAALGYYYGVRVGRIKEKKPGQKETVVTGSAVMSLLMEVRSPNVKKELSIMDFSTDKPFYEYLPATFNIKIKNSGNIHSVPFGDIFIDQGVRKELSVIKVNEGRSNILPSSERVLTADWNDGFPMRVPKMNGQAVATDKKGNTIYDTKWDFSKIANFRIGKYTANLVLVYDNGKQDIPMNASVSFWVLPWKLLLIALAIVLLVLAGVKSIVSSIFRKK